MIPLRRSLSAAATALLLLCVACSGGDAPVDPVWGKVPCAHCAMLVSDKAHGAQVLDERGERLYFDDLGCLVAWEDKHPQRAPRHWVRRGDSQDWARPEETRYARTDHSPMDFGFMGAREAGTADWAEVQAAVRRRLAGGAEPPGGGRREPGGAEQ